MSEHDSDRSNATRNRERNTNDTMAGVSHTNPYTGETAGHLFSRGPIVATDGGEPAATDPNGNGERTSADAEPTSKTMKDVEHTPPHDADDANDVFERGGEHEYGSEYPDVEAEE
ncbi:hypothetical protein CHINAEXTREME_08910 [Halobiforma lacisalsi AJ5]|uniref:Uncharacterized protein n=1 Tax=Natronobacterium lacisalsi AJ5 TaxID=358396 RepID=M0L6J3_NATLA|nr:hypothetical protein [Halobiforma lacisalsi]APW97893.1 hypothetical protein CHINAEXTREME_08910 [Halobiforma lacisalsi AJ5]EMA29161.1 hypothetical protein C445_17474 [Halobiforma lacisalsi AJ5]